MSEAGSRGRGERPANSTLAETLRGWFRQLTGGEGERNDRESLEELLEEHAAADAELEPGQREMLLNILAFGEKRADDLMVPRADIVALPVEAELDEVVQRFREGRHSRLPVYRGTLDDISGFVHIKDVIDHWQGERPFQLASVVRQLLVVPPSMPAIDLLDRMRQSRIHMAIVVDEYGGTDGLVTIEDVVEEIVGDIEDEHDEAEPSDIQELPDGNLEVSGRTELNELEERLGVSLVDEDQEDIDTVAGLLVDEFERVPRRGEILKHASGIDFEVLDADARRVKRLRVTRRPAPEA
ncbi:MAG: HlyC/CorC family transporter [Alphaproteobacteria bacterium]|nr:HlyC/CorC family transporter [Alphaproteobacteria bacterium]